MHETAQKLLYWLLFAFLGYLIFEVLRKLLGGSLSSEELIIGLLIANLTYSFQMRNEIGKLDTRMSIHLARHKGRAASR